MLKAQSQVWDNWKATELLATESPLKMMKSAFYFTLKSSFRSQVFKFLPYFLVMYKNGLIKKIKLISKMMNSQPG